MSFFLGAFVVAISYEQIAKRIVAVASPKIRHETLVKSAFCSSRPCDGIAFKRETLGDRELALASDLGLPFDPAFSESSHPFVPSL